MPIPRLITNPNRLVPNAAQADRNALVTMRGRQQVAAFPEDRNYLRQQRQRQTQRQGVLDNRASYLFMQRAMANIETPEQYEQIQPQLVGQFGISSDIAMPLQKILQDGTYGQFRDTFKEKKTGQLSETNTQDVDYYDEKTKRWMVQKQRYDPDTGKFKPYSTGPKSTQSQDERERQRLEEDLPKIKSFLQRKGPMATYADKWKMHDDGTLYIGARGLPEKLPSFEKVTGKRGNIKAIVEAGRQLDDGIEVIELLQDPEVRKDMQVLGGKGFIDKIKGMTKNRLRKWMQEMGAGGSSKTFEVLVRMQRMSSEERKRLLGAAVTTTELQSVLSWMPDAGDNYEQIVTKMNVGVFEAYEGLNHWLDAFKHDADMSPFYRAFGWDRFNMPGAESFRIKVPGEEGEQELSPIEARGNELEGLGFPEEEIKAILRKEFNVGQ